MFVQVQLSALVPTFGSLFGAQLLDVYVRNPAVPAASTSTAPPDPAFNHTIAPADAWSERLEAQGFASPVWVAPSGSLGTPHFVADAPGTVPMVMDTIAPSDQSASGITPRQELNPDPNPGGVPLHGVTVP